MLKEALSRRSLIKSGIGMAAAAFLVTPRSSLADLPDSPTGQTAVLILERPDFQGRFRRRAPRLRSESPVSLGRPGERTTSQRFDAAAKNSWEDQEQQAGMGHDGMQWFPLPGDPSDRSDRGLLVMNHEYADQGLLFPDGLAGPMTREKVLKSQAAHGVSVIAVERDSAGNWKVTPSRYSRRITARTPMRLTGPAAGKQVDDHRLRSHRAGSAGDRQQLRQRHHALGHVSDLRRELSRRVWNRSARLSSRRSISAAMA